MLASAAVQAAAVGPRREGAGVHAEEPHLLARAPLIMIITISMIIMIRCIIITIIIIIVVVVIIIVSIIKPEPGEARTSTFGMRERSRSESEQYMVYSLVSRANVFRSWFWSPFPLLGDSPGHLSFSKAFDNSSRSETLNLQWANLGMESGRAKVRLFFHKRLKDDRSRPRSAVKAP